MMIEKKKEEEEEEEPPKKKCKLFHYPEEILNENNSGNNEIIAELVNKIDCTLCKLKNFKNTVYLSTIQIDNYSNFILELTNAEKKNVNNQVTYMNINLSYIHNILPYIKIQLSIDNIESHFKNCLPKECVIKRNQGMTEKITNKLDILINRLDSKKGKNLDVLVKRITSIEKVRTSFIDNSIKLKKYNLSDLN